MSSLFIFNGLFPAVSSLCILMAILLSGCSQTPTEDRLTQWRAEAIARNDAIIRQQGKTAKPKKWELFITGQTTKGLQKLDWEELESLATTRVSTTSPHNSKDLKAMLYFRGIAVSQLLDRFGVKPNATSITFLGYDGFSSTVSISDLRRYPIILALERDGRPIPRSEGGPLSLIFPQSEYPQLHQEYAEQFWAFYVTHAIVGNELAKIRIGNRILDSKTLDKLPLISVEETVGYRQGWPIGKVKLHGVRVRDVLNAANVEIADNNVVIVKGKSAVSRDPNNPIRLRSADIRDCDILLVTRWGEDQKPIPSRLGGPITLAFTGSCYAIGNVQNSVDSDRPWLTFVEELEIK
ncbi:molybdopterin-binding protein [Oscillatoriales cyanobacterium USR001]|nr:molybdopterin-binding protein [Oscillatoriales cyanobacterium USR001]